MFISKIINFIKGSLRIEFYGKDITKFFNKLMRYDIHLWNISKINDNFFANIEIKTYIKLYKLRKGYDVKFKIKRRYGLPFIIKRYKKRFGLLIGFLIFIIFLIIMSQFIWSIEVHGNKSIDSNQLIKFISSQKIYPGKFRKNIDVKTIERSVLLKFKKISWISINILGSKAYIEINERTMPPKHIDRGETCNIVASKNGVIKRIEAYQGQNLVDINDFVKKDQILVSGIMEDKSLNDSLVHARAKAIALVTETFRYRQPLTFQKKHYQTLSTNYSLEAFNKQIPLNYTKKIDSVPIYYSFNTIYPKLFNISLPFNIKKRHNNIISFIPIHLSAQEAKSCLIKKISQTETEMKNNNIKIISKQIINNSLENNCYIIDIKYNTEQDIAKPQNIIFDNN